MLAGYVVLLLVNRQLSARLRHERHDAQVQETTRLLQQLLPQQADTTSELQRHLADLASPSLLVWMVWLEPERPAIRAAAVGLRIRKSVPMSTPEIKAVARPKAGKGPARQARRDGRAERARRGLPHASHARDGVEGGGPRVAAQQAAPGGRGSAEQAPARDRGLAQRERCERHLLM